MNFLKCDFKNQKFSHNLYLTVLFTLFVFAPDFVLKTVCHLPIGMEMLFFLGVVLFGALLSLTNKIAIVFFGVLVFVMQLIQLNFMTYFGSPIEPANLMNIFRETRDIFDPAYLKETWFVTPTLTLFFVLWLVGCFKFRPIKLPFVWLILFYLASHKPYRAYTQTKGIWYFQPALTRPSLKNSISTFSYFVFQYWPKGYQNVAIEYKPYTLHDVPSDVQNVLLIWGESLYAGHLPMYGYQRDTFPKVQSLLNEQGWQSALALSGGIATATSTLLFFNTAREPANADVFKKHPADLFRAAKQHGFATYYLSNQESRLTMGMDVASIDELMTNDMNPIYFAKYKDEGLTKILEEKGLKGAKNFVVLHMRSPHSPYENRYEGRENEFEKFKPATSAKDRLTYETNTYDNALLYTDMVIFDMVKAFEKLAQGTNYKIYITADHGQLFDWQNMWGHNNLVIEQAKVPLFVKGYDAARLPDIVSHYQIGKMILRDLGVELDNPNETDNIYYLHGNNIDFPYDYIEYQITGDDVREIKRANTNP